MNQKNKYSIILPTYNRANSYLKNAIESVINQTYENWELLVIDNYSTDNTRELIKSYEKRNIKFLINYTRGNIAKSRNLGIKKSTGDYIAFIDSDDTWEPQKLEECEKIYGLNSDTLICHSEKWQYENNQMKIVHYGPTKNATYKNLLIKGNCLSLSATVVPKYFFSKIGSFSERSEIISAEDYDLWIRIAKNNFQFLFLTSILGTFRVHSKSISSDILNNTRAVNNVLALYDYKKDSIPRSWQIAGKRYQLNGDKYLALVAYAKSLKNYKNLISSLLHMFTLIIPTYMLKIFFVKK